MAMMQAANGKPGRREATQEGSPLVALLTERHSRVAVLVVLALSAVLAVHSLLGDSITFDETSHLTAGMSYLKTGDFRLAHDHPPLGKMWAALPLLLMEQEWPSADSMAWRLGSVWSVGWAWLFQLNNGERLLMAARCMIVLLSLGTCLCIYSAARSLFGPSAGLLALFLSAFGPTILAHGRLVTTDMPLTVCTYALLLAFARLAVSMTWGRLLATVLATAALSLVKFSWPLVLPAVVVMTAVSILRKTPLPCRLTLGNRAGRDKPSQSGWVLASRRSRLIGFALVWTVTAGATWVLIWTCYGWRYSPFTGPDADTAFLLPEVTSVADLPADMEGAWAIVLTDRAGKPAGNLGAGFVRWARAHRLLPEAYLFGLAHTLKTSRVRASYLNGRFSSTGWRSYFPIAFAIKTPVPTLLLLAIAVIAFVTRHAPIGRDPVLLAGVVAAAAIYSGFVIVSNLNIGHRHLLPIYPAVIILASASTSLLGTRLGKWVIGFALIWVVANLRIHPHYLSYFNEFVGGPNNGHLYLADSNIDWGQDLKRLASYLEENGDGTVKLAYFGSGDPTEYGVNCEMLKFSMMPFAPPAELTAGTYVISVTHLLGVNWPEVRDQYWESLEAQGEYQALSAGLSGPAKRNATTQQQRDRRARADRYQGLQRARLVCRLRHRTPEDRVGYSLFVYRLTDSEVQELIAP